MRSAAFFLTLGLTAAAADTAADTAPEPSPALVAAVERLQLPGVKINLDERAVDVDATVCLDSGALELVACTAETKQHESIVTIRAKAVHIHTALLLLGTKAGHPAMRQRVGGEDGYWVDVPPKGGKVDVSFVVPSEGGEPVERPVREFIAPNPDLFSAGEEPPSFPTDTFLFAGSRLVPNDDGPPTYICEREGNVISIATFGDELLCLPKVHSKDNGALLWQVDPTHLPPVGTKVTLRLRPKKP